MNKKFCLLLKIKSFLFVPIIFVTLLFSATGWSQASAETVEDPVSSTDDFSRPDKSVPIVQSPTDDPIAKRLTRIVGVTNWVKGLKINSRAGVVSLTGLVRFG